MMIVKIAWSSLYLQFSSFNFLMSGLFGDILCLRFFLSWAYFWLFVNAVTGFPNWNELFEENVFLLHFDVLLWTTVTLYVHLSKFIGIVLNERKVTTLPPESLPLYRMMYRNGGLSELLFQQFVWPRFELVLFSKGDTLDDGNESLYIILDGTTRANITLQGRTKELLLGSGEAVHVKWLHLFRQASQSEAFAAQTVRAVAETDMRVYKCTPTDIEAIARQPQTKQAYQGLLIFVLTRIAERAILEERGIPEAPVVQLHPAFGPLEAWEEPSPLNSGSGKALQMPVRHFWTSLQRSFRPPYPIIRWIPGLRHANLPAPHSVPPAPPSVSDELSEKQSMHGKKLYGSIMSSSGGDSDRGDGLQNGETTRLLV